MCREQSYSIERAYTNRQMQSFCKRSGLQICFKKVGKASIQQHGIIGKEELERFSVPSGLNCLQHRPKCLSQS